MQGYRGIRDKERETKPKSHLACMHFITLSLPPETSDDLSDTQPFLRFSWTTLPADRDLCQINPRGNYQSANQWCINSRYPKPQTKEHTAGRGSSNGTREADGPSGGGTGRPTRRSLQIVSPTRPGRLLKRATRWQHIPGLAWLARLLLLYYSATPEKRFFCIPTGAAAPLPPPSWPAAAYVIRPATRPADSASLSTLRSTPYSVN